MQQTQPNKTARRAGNQRSRAATPTGSPSNRTASVRAVLQQPPKRPATQAPPQQRPRSTAQQTGQGRVSSLTTRQPFT